MVGRGVLGFTRLSQVRKRSGKKKQQFFKAREKSDIEMKKRQGKLK